MIPRKAAIYVREVPLYPEYEVLGTYDEEKWGGFDELLRKSSGDVDFLIVAKPEVLGDTYVELLVNLSKIAKAGLRLAIAEPAYSIREL